MKISLKWLRDYIDVDLSNEELAHKFIMSGSEVEQMHDYNGDTVFEFEITPNRADCLCMLGMAREISAMLDKDVKAPEVKEINISTPANVKIEDDKGCKRYIGIVLEGVEIKPSPVWLKERIEALGMRSVNNIVDVTNFCMMENGQPLHAFDLDKLVGQGVIVRKAKDKEKIVVIDGSEKILDASILVIADEKKPVAIAGIMGGKDTEVSSSTKNILLESAYFDPITIRRASRKLVLASDSSYRFERGMDITNVDNAAYRAAHLIVELAGGKITKKSDAGSQQISGQSIIGVSLKDINGYIGGDLSLERCKKILERLGFGVNLLGDHFKLTAPTFRPDVSRKVDVIEEISRIIGYDNLPISMPQVKALSMSSEPKITLRKKIRQIFLNQGFSEIVPFSLISEKNAKDIGLRNCPRLMPIVNPISQEQGFLRSILLPSFLNVVLANFNKGQKNLRLFEIGKAYRNKENIKDSTELEQERVGFILVGAADRGWKASAQKEDFYTLKGVLDILGLNTDKASENLGFMDSDYSADVLFEESKIGFAGKVNEEVLNAWGIKEKNIFYCEFVAKFLYAKMEEVKKFVPPVDLPSIGRDLSLAVSKEIFYKQIEELIWSKKPINLQAVGFVDEYVGDKLPAGQKGLTISFVYRSEKHTLKDEEVSPVHEALVKEILQELKATRR
ncbi:MAG: phenylalanine--tRNA ligase subunit beta [Candidatus Omnitrophica bacterium]|nr:phenylalanine--tRNA ligase subunit beta [Candidatus Omnitrophota bacterium]